MRIAGSQGNETYTCVVADNGFDAIDQVSAQLPSSDREKPEVSNASIAYPLAASNNCINEVCEMICICKKEVLYWHEDTYVFVYGADNKCQRFCQLKELDVYRIREEFFIFGAARLFLEPADANKNLCTPKTKYFPPECVGPTECTYPGVSYRFETEQQDWECSSGGECFGENGND